MIANFFAHFGLTIVIIFIDFFLTIGASFFYEDWKDWDFEEACEIGYFVNMIGLAIALSFLILGD